MTMKLEMREHRIMIMAISMLLLSAGQSGWSQSAPSDPYPLAKCPVTGNKLKATDALVIGKHEGRELRFCSSACPDKFQSDREGYLAKIDKSIVKQQLAHYAMSSCPVSGQKLGAMGDAVDYVYKNRLVRFCCSGCIKEFEKNSAKFTAKMDAAVIDAQKHSYPLKTCLVSGEELGGEMGPPIDFVMANRLFLLCCEFCKEKLTQDPAKYFSLLTEGAKGHMDGMSHGPESKHDGGESKESSGDHSSHDHDSQDH